MFAHRDMATASIVVCAVILYSVHCYCCCFITFKASITKHIIAPEDHHIIHQLWKLDVCTDMNLRSTIHHLLCIYDYTPHTALLLYSDFQRFYSFRLWFRCRVRLPSTVTSGYTVRCGKCIGLCVCLCVWAWEFRVHTYVILRIRPLYVCTRYAGMYAMWVWLHMSKQIEIFLFCADRCWDGSVQAVQQGLSSI